MSKRIRRASKPRILSAAEWQALGKKQAAEEAAAIANAKKGRRSKSVASAAMLQARETELIERAWSKASPWKNLTGNAGGGVNLEARLGVRYKKPPKVKFQGWKPASPAKPGKS